MKGVKAEFASSLEGQSLTGVRVDECEMEKGVTTVSHKPIYEEG